MTTTRPPWRPLSAGVAAAGLVGVLCPLPSSAAPAPCAHPQRHAAEAGAQLLRLHRLDLGPTGRPGAAVTDTVVGEGRSAMLAQHTISAAAARALGPRAGTPRAGQPTDGSAPAELTRAVRQQAPPAHPTAAQAGTPARQVGQLDLGEGSLTSRARWDAALACGSGDGEVTRARAVLAHVGLLTDDSGRALLRLPQRAEARGTTALQRRGTVVHTVARSSITTGTVEVLGGAVRVTIVKPPTLSTSISAAGAAEVRYVPAMLEVSGAGFGTIVLTTPGDQAELRLDTPAGATRAGTAARPPGPGAGGADPVTESVAVPTVPGDPLRRLLAGLPVDALRAGTPGAGTPGAGAAPPVGDPAGLLALPRIPEVPPLPGGGTDKLEESGDTRSMLRVTLGEVRQAVVGHAVAARVAALRLEITAGVAAGPSTGASAAGRPTRGGTVLDLDVGMLEAAAVAPAPGPGTTGTAVTGTGTAGGAGGGLPVTGARIDMTVVAGAALLTIGLVCLVVGLRRRTFRT